MRDRTQLAGSNHQIGKIDFPDDTFPYGVIAMTLVSGVWAAEGGELFLVLAA